MKVKIMKNIHSFNILAHQPFSFLHVFFYVKVESYISTVIIFSVSHYTQPLHFDWKNSTNSSGLSWNTTFWGKLSLTFKNKLDFSFQVSPIVS